MKFLLLITLSCFLGSISGVPIPQNPTEDGSAPFYSVTPGRDSPTEHYDDGKVPLAPSLDSPNMQSPNRYNKNRGEQRESLLPSQTRFNALFQNSGAKSTKTAQEAAQEAARKAKKAKNAEPGPLVSFADSSDSDGPGPQQAGKQKSGK